MKKNPFKKQSIIDTVMNVGIGGAANVAMDYAVENIDALKTMEANTINAGKIALGALIGSMVSNKYLRAAADGIATVGVSTLIKDSMIASEGNQGAPAGLPYGTIGKLRRAGNAAFRRHHVSGVASPEAFMSK